MPLLGVLLLLVVGAAIARKSEVNWRAQVLAWKVTGTLADMPWLEVFAAVAPHTLSSKLHLAEQSVSEKARGEEPCPVLWGTRDGLFWGRHGDGSALEVASRYRALDHIYLRGFMAVRNGDVVIDGGSHLGTFTRFALDRGARLVVAFEPDRTSNACFERTFRDESSRDRVVLVKAALWERPGVLSFISGSSSLLGAVNPVPMPVWKCARATDVPATTIDETVQRLKLDRVDFIKLNIEGAERNALLGARETVARYHPRLVVNTEHRSDDPSVIRRLATEAFPGYHVLRRGSKQEYFY